MKHILKVLWIIFMLGSQLTFAQKAKQGDPPQNPLFLFGFEYGFNFVGGDLSQRFGPNLKLGGSLSFMPLKKNYHFGLRASYYFGDTVRQDVLAHLRDANGNILGINYEYAQVKLRQRGYEAFAFFSKVFPTAKSNSRTGFRMDIGAGIYQHWIRLQDDFVTAAQLNDPYDKGYDRMTNGLALTQFLGYQYISLNKRVNFYAGFEFLQAFTQNRRYYDFATMGVDTEKRTDLMYGIKAGWILPIYIEKSPETIYY